MHNIYKIRQIPHTNQLTYNNRLRVLWIIYRELARAFGIFDLLFPLLAEAIHTQELDRK